MKLYRLRRVAIAVDDPVAQQMWKDGHSLKEIATTLSLPVSTYTFGVIDPTPQPLGCPPYVGKYGETPEQRAFRRFPVDCHKPAGMGAK